MIPVIYGAIFSYAFYILTTIGAGYYEALFVREELSGMTFFQIINPFDAIGSGILRQLSIFLILYSFILKYMVEDIGSIIKLEKLFPFKRTSRYTHEIIIGLFYISIFYFMQINSFFALLLFSINVIWRGVWTKHLSGEYLGEPISFYAKTMYSIHFIWGFILLLSVSIEMFLGINEMSWIPVFVFMTIYVLMKLSFAIIPVFYHGTIAGELGINLLVPDKLIKKIANWKRLELIL